MKRLLYSVFSKSRGKMTCEKSTMVSHGYGAHGIFKV
jgi:hypothetical protein